MATTRNPVQNATAPPEGYVYGLRFRWLTPLYDAFIAATMRERRLRTTLLEGADIRAGMRILDVGCGTATLTVMAKQKNPRAEIVGLDGDPSMLARARVKAARGSVAIRFDLGLATALPYSTAAFDRVLSSLMLHHLRHDAKRAAFTEIGRVLRPGGELYIADFGPPVGFYARLAFGIARRIDGWANTADNAAGALPDMLVDAGFTDVRVGETVQTCFGTVLLLSARRPGHRTRD